MKLTLIFVFTSVTSSSGSGVASACGGSSASHSERLGCVMAANSEPCIGDAQTTCSCWAKEFWPATVPAGAGSTAARHMAGNKRINMSPDVRTNILRILLRLPATSPAFYRWAYEEEGAIGRPGADFDAIERTGVSLTTAATRISKSENICRKREDCCP